MPGWWPFQCLAMHMKIIEKNPFEERKKMQRIRAKERKIENNKRDRGPMIHAYIHGTHPFCMVDKPTNL